MMHTQSKGTSLQADKQFQTSLEKKEKEIHNHMTCLCYEAHMNSELKSYHWGQCFVVL